MGHHKFFPDLYSSFEELAHREEEERDFSITQIFHHSPILIVAPHGGLIEGGTSEIADGIVDGRLNGYFFNGLTYKSTFDQLYKGREGGTARRMHLKSTRPQGERLDEALDHAELVVGVHGWWVPSEDLYIGGTQRQVMEALHASLRTEGFSARYATESGFDIRGIHPKNFINRNQQGVQIELCYGLRKKLKTDAAALELFSKTIREVLLEF